MTGSRKLAGDATPRFPAHVKFRFDERRQAWIVLSPERLFLPDEQAVEILRLIDGVRTIDMIVDSLAEAFDAPREEIDADVVAMLRELVEKRVLEW
jgi:pyrroloquinoline quinone biosynthesis protein D